VVLCVLLAAYGLAPNLSFAAVAIAGVGAAYIGVLTGLNTTIQLRAPAQHRGRVLGIYMMALGILYPIGALVQGALGDRLGLREVTVSGGVVLLLVMAALVVIRGWLGALEAPAQAAVNTAVAVPDAALPGTLGAGVAGAASAPPGGPPAGAATAGRR